MTQTDFMSNPDLCTSAVLQDLIQASASTERWRAYNDVEAAEALAAGKLEFSLLMDHVGDQPPEFYVIGLQQLWFEHCSLSSGRFEVELPSDWMEDVLVNVPDEWMRERVVQIIKREYKI